MHPSLCILVPLMHAPSMWVNRDLASSAALAASLGRMKTFGDESIAAMERISLEHLGPDSHDDDEHDDRPTMKMTENV